MTDDLTIAQRVIATAQISSVRLVESRAVTSIREPQEAGADPVQSRQTLSATRKGGGFRVLADLGISIPSKEKSAPPAVAIDARFELDYSFPQDLNPSDEELSAFARVNGLFNAWPYFREFVQASMARMQLPPIVLPLVRVVRPTPVIASAAPDKTLGPSADPELSSTSSPTDSGATKDPV